MRPRVALSPGQIVLTTSTSEAYSFLFRLLCDPGSEILVPSRATRSSISCRAGRCAPEECAAGYDHGWQIDPEGFLRAITPKTRAIVLVHPNNPTGHFTKPWRLRNCQPVPGIQSRAHRG